MNLCWCFFSRQHSDFHTWANAIENDTKDQSECFSLFVRCHDSHCLYSSFRPSKQQYGLDIFLAVHGGLRGLHYGIYFDVPHVIHQWSHSSIQTAEASARLDQTTSLAQHEGIQHGCLGKSGKWHQWPASNSVRYDLGTPNVYSSCWIHIRNNVRARSYQSWLLTKTCVWFVSTLESD